MQYSKEPPDRAHMQRVVRRSLPLLLFMVPRPPGGQRAARQQLWRCPRTRCPLARWSVRRPPSLLPRTHASQISRAAEAAANARGPKHQNGRPTDASFVFLHNKWPLCMILSRTLATTASFLSNQELANSPANTRQSQRPRREEETNE